MISKRAIHDKLNMRAEVSTRRRFLSEMLACMERLEVVEAIVQTGTSTTSAAASHLRTGGFTVSTDSLDAEARSGGRGSSRRREVLAR